MTNTRMFNTWQARLDSGELTKAQIQQFYNGVYTRAWGDEYPGGMKTNLTQSEAEILVMRVEKTPVRVGAVQAQQGRDWLAKYWKQRGMLNLDYQDISYFTFDGAAVIAENRYRTTFAPIYTAHWCNNGERLTYNVCAWQANRGSHVDWLFKSGANVTRSN